MTDYSYDENENSVLDELIRYADHNKGFNRKFIDDLYDFREKNGFLTEAQIDKLHEIQLRLPSNKE